MKMKMKMNTINLLISVLVIFVVFNISLPEDIYNIANKKEMKIGVIIGSLMIAFKQPLVGVLIMIMYFILVNNSHNFERKKSFGGGPSEKYKKKHMKLMNKSFPVTLEEEIIKGQESNKTKATLPNATYKPLLEKTCNQSLKL